MKKIVFALLIVLISVFLSGSFYEKVDSNLEKINESEIINGVSEETLEILEELGIDEISIEAVSNLSFEKIFEKIKYYFVSSIKFPFYSISSVLIVGILCVILQNSGGFSNQIKSVYSIVSALAVSSTMILPIKNVIVSVSEVIKECSDFMLSFIPVYSSALISAGYVSSAVGYRTLLLGAVTIISKISSNVIVPFVCIYLGLSISDSISSINLGQVAKYIKDFTVWILGLLMAVFSGVLGLGTLIASSVDKIGSKAFKFVVGSAVPVIGGTISDMLLTLKSCLVLTKDVLGTYSIIVIAVIFVPLLVKTIAWKVSLSLGGILGDLLDNKNMSDIFRASSSVMGIMLALVVTVLIMMIFSVAIMLLTVRA